MKLPGLRKKKELDKERILVFDDEPSFAKSLKRSLETNHGYYVEAISSVQRLDTEDTWHDMTDFWDCIVTDVDFENAKLGGHEIIRNRVVERGLNCPVIVISGKRDIILSEIKKLYGSIFSAYLSKNEVDFEATLVTAIARAIHNAPEEAINRLEQLFDSLDKLDYEMDRDEITSEIMGIKPREGVTTIRMMINDFKTTRNMDRETNDFYLEKLWKKYADFISGRYE